MIGKFLFNSVSSGFKLKDPLVYKTFFPLIFEEEKFLYKTITYIFCGDDYIKNLNVEFLSHNTYTDILTFCLSDKTKPIIAEIYISIDRIRENASLFKVSFDDELNRVMIHGLLHLCEYEDHTPILKLNMKKREDYYLEKLNR